MGYKRSHPGGEAGGHDHENPDRKRLRTGHTPKVYKARPKTPAVENDGLNAIKKRARAIERLLARDNLKLPATKQKDLERELAAHKMRIEDARTKKERGRMIQKYHMVRFFGTSWFRLPGLPASIHMCLANTLHRKEKGNAARKAAREEASPGYGPRGGHSAKS
jgi:hypothetical protein